MRPQDYIITRPHLLRAITEIMEDGGITADGKTPSQIVAMIMLRRDLADAETVRNSEKKWEEIEDARNQAAEDPSDAGSAGS